MSVYIDIHKISNNNTLKDLVIPSCLFIDPVLPKKNFVRLNIKEDPLIDDKLFDILIDTLPNANKKITRSKNKNNKKLKTRKKK